MNIEEYKTIREEMLSRFRWTFEVIFFSIVSTSAIISWLILKESEIPPLGPYLLIIVGLGIVTYLFWFYSKTLKSIYKQGSYLIVFHELENDSLRWHILSRFQNKFRCHSSKWGSDGRNAAILLIILGFVNIVGPLCTLNGIILSKLSDQILFVIMIVTIIFLIIFLCIVFQSLWKTKEFMYENMNNWLNLKEKLCKDELFKHSSTYNERLEDKIKEILENK